jgi:hypothetical protein
MWLRRAGFISGFHVQRLKLEDHLWTTVRPPEKWKRRRAREYHGGDNFSHKHNRWFVIERTINRVWDWYRERITDKTTGEVVVDVGEPLSAHTEHGSARHRGGFRS